MAGGSVKSTHLASITCAKIMDLHTRKISKKRNLEI
jgi:hypothetical protein